MRTRLVSVVFWASTVETDRVTIVIRRKERVASLAFANRRHVPYVSYKEPL